MAPRNRVPKSSWESEDAPKEPRRICSTSGKQMYPSEREANSTAAHQMRDTQSAPSHLRSYKCLYCGAWHLTSKNA
jgi:hypothetical protein